ncbi:hypothetical protein [Ereboglobus sp. PH5-10]|uniref:hypothetical protein n=1 Tax=Ereboglobus sp. PH5-10 TaxID=2940629 RepID=UPI0024069B0C|nr:hypothetical protein [Ereboglobus sp. PH5-10]
MSLSYHYSFRAPSNIESIEIEQFLKRAEIKAKEYGLGPTLVENAKFDTPEKRAFSRRITRGLTLEDPRLIDVTLPENICWAHYKESGLCRIAPVEGVFMVVTEENGIESVWGLFRFPSLICDKNGRSLMKRHDGDDWISEGFIDSPDQRYRQIAHLFKEAGWLVSERDEFAVKASNT